MAIKPKVKKADDQTTLKAETEEKVEVKKLLQDERTHKITGAVFLMMAALLFIGFTSYLFTWEEDQDKVFQHGYKLLLGTDAKVNNLLGTLGAFLSHFFIYKGFGIASYLICSTLFVIGVNLFFGKKVFAIGRNIKYVLIGLVVLSVAASVIMNGKIFPWGGAVGDMIKVWMYEAIGQIGTIAILGVVLLSYIIWRFNPVFTLPTKKTLLPVDIIPEEKSVPTELAVEDDDPEEETIEETVTNTGKGGMRPIPSQENPALNHDIKIVEKDEVKIPEPEPIEEEIVPEPEPVAPAKTAAASALELEIKTVPDKPAEEIPQALAEKAKAAPAPYDPILDLRDYKYPTLDLLENHGSDKIVQDTNELENNKNQIINTLKNYDIAISKISATVGPTVTLYEIIPAAGVRISRIKNLEDDIALSLAALGIRIIAPIPGKGTIGIEVPNAKKSVVSMKTLLASEKFQKNNFSLPIAIGKKIDNENFIVDLAAMPHLLMAGATGQGKSVGLNAILVSLLYKKHPSQLKFVLVDPKKVELSIYKTIEKHFLAKLPDEGDAIITDTKKVVHTLNALCIEMDNRYDLLKEAGCRNIREYNEKFAARKLNPEKGHQFLPFIVLVVDEFADLIMTAGKEVEMPIARLAQLARAIGIHLIIATQRPSVNIITGTIKANFPARIAFKVSSKIDSRTILDAGGAEQLIGKGDMLISYNGELVRLQCAFVDTPEVDKIVDFIGDQRGYPQAFLLPEYVDEKDMEAKDFDLNDKDPLFEDAARLIVASQVGSTSLLQRRMKLGYNRAGRLMDQLEAAGVVGANQGSKARDVLIKTEADLQMYLDNNL
ncbi:DNA translocase FtsK 4TM domain-containing protein [Ferruginibacter lapsinanis]|uniref:FtsK/SpoIIIE family DNA translocase n=1 Tax=Ferruginibacter lapsinanis TaxID=563172 RepID=UPI001E4DE416|nr:DNA translocase FtsK 4TM domain-containing protein [Ferruginibacter lapsinanis]UEG50192.1 DNA translocase FtsK 4TM domain-containing protein [Ferruginibacter lapsinanis]